MYEFTDKEIKTIARRTDRNFHSENLLFIAKRLKSPILKDLQVIHKKHMAQGYMDGQMSSDRYALFQKLMQELREKNPGQAEAVYGAL
jgi:methionine salvage enolase-phosphatase E1